MMFKMMIVLLVIVVVVVLILTILTGRRERFLSGDFLSILHIQPPESSRVPISLDDVPDDLLPAIKSAQPAGLTFKKDKSKNNVRIENALDVYANQVSHDSRVVYATSMRRSFVMYSKMTPQAVRGMVNMSTSRTDKYVYHCPDAGCEFILNIIAAAHRMKINIKRDEKRTESTHDIVCVLVNSQIASKIPDGMQLINYADKQVSALLSIKAPFVRVLGTYATSVYPAYTSKQAIIDLACAEDLLVTPPAFSNSSVLSILSDELILHPVDNVLIRSHAARNAFYAGYFKFTPASMRAIRAVQIKHESFKEETLEPEIVTGTFASIENVRTIRTANELDGIPLRIGDRLELKKQGRLAENGSYIVSARDIDGAMLTSPPVIEDLTGTRLRMSKSKVSIVSSGGIVDVLRLVLVPGEDVYIRPLHCKGTVVSVNRIDLIENVDPIQDSKFDPKSLCVTNTSEVTKELCESGFDKERGIWDRPCTKDVDCPFYSSDKRGGCMDSGYCELPLGVKRLSFRKYSGEPMCRNCLDPYDAFCCDDHDRPDYAFE